MNDNADIPDYTPPGEPPKWYNSAWCSRGFLLMAALFFLLPFINIKCSGAKLASITGVDLLKGGEIKKGEAKTESDSTDTTSNYNWGGGTAGSLFQPGGSDLIFEEGDQKKIAPNVLAIVSMAGLVLGLIFSFFKARMPIIIGGGFAILGALTLFFIQIQVNSAIETKIGPFNFSPIAFEFTPYYWCAILFMAAAGVFAFVRSRVVGK